jgi:RNA polymerase sigma-70 factor (ECF subfamily)
MPEPVLSDEQILALIDSPATVEKGFRLLVCKYQERLYRHIRQMVFQHEDADDILQNSLLKAFQGIGGFERRSSLFTWLYRIATNEALSFLNRKKQQTVPLDTDLAESPVNRIAAASYFDGEALHHQLISAMRQLPDKQRQVFVLRYFEALSYKEISAILDTSEGALKASFHHAVKKIEQYFRESA